MSNAADNAHSVKCRCCDSVMSRTCQDCGVENPMWSTRDWCWRPVMGEDSEMVVCPPCFIKRAEAAGWVPTKWILQPTDPPSHDSPLWLAYHAYDDGSDGGLEA